MLTSKLNNVGDSIMFAVPAEVVRMLHLEAGDRLAITVEDGRLVAEPRRRPRYTMAELLAESDYSASQPEGEREWIDGWAVGRELL